MKNTSLKKKLQNKELTIGSWITIGHPAIPEILANAGFEWLVIDIEHTTIDFSMVQSLITSIQSKGMAALVRVSKNEEVVIKRVLDAGADGIIVPMVCNVQDARNAVSYAKYPPEGTRGVGLARAQNYGFGFNSYKQWIKKHLVVIAQIEHYEGINNLNEIIETEGIDGTIIGPYDLSGSLGFPGEYDKENVKDLLEKFKQICKTKKISMGFHVINPQIKKLKEKIDEGYNFLAFSTDFLFMGENAKNEMDKINK
ncbi:MAG: aldolase/citrate lyase family protein [Candidatus Margulisbacteria bacterium]|nr:aldolase/citrate lyase family protein [Candidatus Margulisiibacteriota bacterium]